MDWKNLFKWYFLEIDVKYPPKLYEFHSDLPFLLDRKKLGKAEKLVTNLQDQTKYFVCIKTLKQTLNHGLILQKVHRAF